MHATDFVSTEAKLSAEELSKLARLIADNRVPVIFQDNQANPQAVTSLREAVWALGWEVQISAEELYADSLRRRPRRGHLPRGFRPQRQSCRRRPRNGVTMPTPAAESTKRRGRIAPLRAPPGTSRWRTGPSRSCAAWTSASRRAW